MTQEEHDKDMIESIEMWLHEIEPKWVEKELNWLDKLRTRLLKEKSEKPSEDLEEAAKDYFYHNWSDGSLDIKGQVIEDFIAGAEWQKEQMELDGIVTLTESDFDAEKEKASEWGYNLCKEQMMKDALEAKIYGYDDGSFELIASWLDMPNNSIYKDGDKVKIIIIKDND